MPYQRTLIHAPNIHSGGGATLLNQLLANLGKHPVRLIVDARMPLDEHILANNKIYRVKPTLLHRFLAELLLKKIADKNDLVLCFGNLPPLFRVKSKIFVFLQNIYLLNKSGSQKLAFRTRLRLAIERFWFALRHQYADKIIVQTPSMSRELEKSGVPQSKILIAPLFSLATEPSRASEKKYDFIYVADGLAHKNHKNLIEAWVVLAEKNIRPSLCLTLNEAEHPKLGNWIKLISAQHQLNITNFPSASLNEVHCLYTQSRALIFPSLIESFGLPLLEAEQHKLDILAPELDYVRDLINPCQTFNPLSKYSIAHAVNRYLGNSKKIKIFNACEFFDLLGNYQ